MITQIEYEEYHKAFADHLMRDVDIIPEFRIVEVEYYDRAIAWFKSDKFNFTLLELMVIDKPIRSILIT